MAENVLISIITINFNNLEGLKKTMASVFEQTYKNFEYLIIDGHSTDGSLALIKQNESKISYSVSEPDSGIYNAMNKGVKKSKGKYLLFLNSGDYLYNNDVLGIISRDLYDCDLLYGNIIKVFKDGRKFVDKGKNANEITLNTFYRGSLNHQALFVKQSLFKRYGLYDEDLQIVSDWKFFLITLGLNNSKLKYVDRNIAFYDMTGISNNNELRNSEREKVLEELIPDPILKDYSNLMEMNSFRFQNRFKMLLELEKSPFARKINSVLFRILLKVTLGKKIKDI
ncbi:glycosyltransferase family 2 protein [uncultured Salegentibacter sp.]|uniref:glycosyltransferase family 2 protein n=1 Tax=uncultured Salegentibacter sp. TaxID=259320 RepID=UPI0025928CDA|nr:glycosyltransferase family 2 protein [uncultured Salegentibacter sp.]